MKARVFDNRFVDHVNRNPNMSNHFWKQRLEKEDNHQFISTIKGIELGRVGMLQVTNDFGRSLSSSRTDDPFVIAKKIKESNLRKEKMPLK